MVNENIFLLHAICLGLGIIFVYDLLAICRRVIPHSGFWVSFEDLAFCIFCGVEVFLLMYRESNGTLRWFAVLGALAGMFLYKKTISKYFRKAMIWLLQKIICILQKFFGLLLKPVIWMAKKFFQNSKWAAGKMSAGGKRSLTFCKKKLTQGMRMVKISITKH
jgi:hypothetical protein